MTRLLVLVWLLVVTEVPPLWIAAIVLAVSSRTLVRAAWRGAEGRLREPWRHLETRLRRPCSVCRQPNAPGHGCHVYAFGVSHRDQTRNSLWRGVVRDHYAELWGCDHTHDRRAAARNCARRQMRRYQTGKAPADQVIGPRPQATRIVHRVPVADLTPGDWERMVRQADNQCHYCRQHFHIHELEQEHRIPLSRGGPNTITNIVPACRPCNRRKGTMTDDEFFDYLDKTRERQSARHPPLAQSRTPHARRSRGTQNAVCPSCYMQISPAGHCGCS